MSDAPAAGPRRPGAGARAALGSVLTGGSLQLVAVATGIIAARLLGVDDRGRLALLWLVTLLAGQLGTLGLHAAVAYSIAEGEPPERVLARLRGVIGRALVGAPVLQVLVLLLVVDHWPGEMLVAAATTLVVSPVLVLWLIALGVAQGAHRFGALQRHRVVQPLVYLGGLLVVVAAGSDDLAVVTAAWSATMVAAGAYAWRDCTGGWRLPRGDREPEASRALVRFGLGGLFGTFGAAEHFMLDQLLVGAFLPARELGLYVVATAFANLPRFLGQSIGYVAYPQVAAAAPAARRSVLLRYLGLAAALLVPTGAVLMVAAGPAIPVFFGDAFADAAPITTLLILAAVVQALRRVLTEASRGLGSGTAGSASEIVFTVVLVAAAIPLMDGHGAEGAAAASLLAGVAAAVVLVATIVRGRTRIDPPPPAQTIG